MSELITYLRCCSKRVSIVRQYKTSFHIWTCSRPPQPVFVRFYPVLLVLSKRSSLLLSVFEAVVGTLCW